MHMFFFALVCAAMVGLGCTPLAAYHCRGGESGATQWHTIEARGLDAAREDNGFAVCLAANEPIEAVVNEEYAAMFDDRTHLCDAYAEVYINGKRVVRRQFWASVTGSVGTIHRRGRDMQVLLFFSGDPLLDLRYREKATIARGSVSPKRFLQEMQQGAAEEVLARALSGATTDKPIRAEAICWPNGTPEPDRSTWPGSGHTCAGVISARTILDGVDMTAPWTRWYMVRNVPGSSPSDAETIFRRRLHDHGRAKAAQDGGVMQLIPSPDRGFVTSESLICWKGKPPTAPIGWPEKVMSWENEVLRHGFADWSDDDPVPTQRNPQPLTDRPK